VGTGRRLSRVRVASATRGSIPSPSNVTRASKLRLTCSCGLLRFELTGVVQYHCKPRVTLGAFAFRRTVEFDPHQKCGVAGTGRSSSAEAAANAIAAFTCSTFRAGKSRRISSTESPAARLANTVRRVTRVPRNTGSPPQICGSLTIWSSWFIGGNPSRIQAGLSKSIIPSRPTVPANVDRVPALAMNARMGQPRNSQKG